MDSGHIAYIDYSSDNMAPLRNWEHFPARRALCLAVAAEIGLNFIGSNLSFLQQSLKTWARLNEEPHGQHSA